MKEILEPVEQCVITVDPQVGSAHFSECGRFLLAGSFDGRVRRWDVSDPQTPRELEAFTQHQAWVSPVVTRDGVAFSADSWGGVAAWRYDADGPQTLWSVEEAHDGWCRQLAITKDCLATCGRDQRIGLWNPADGNSIGELQGHENDIYSLAFHPSDSNLLASGDAKGIVKIWDLAARRCLRDLDASLLFTLHRLQDVGGVKCLTFDATGERLAACGTKPKNGGTVQGEPTIMIFDVATGQLKQTLFVGPSKDCYVHEMHFHSDGYIMAVTCGAAGTGRLLFQKLDAEKPFYASKKLINCHSLSRSPDGSRLAVTTTNRNSNGNGRRLDDDGQYEGNTTPIHMLSMPQSE
ncbi:MAG: hypothetical protein R3C05_06955 [Pirellulaceae bacterium]